jgi:hypothetical protein
MCRLGCGVPSVCRYNVRLLVVGHLVLRILYLDIWSSPSYTDSPAYQIQWTGYVRICLC